MRQRDERAEGYLRVIMSSAEGQEFGAVPSAFPSSTFELTLVSSSLSFILTGLEIEPYFIDTTLLRLHRHC